MRCELALLKLKESLAFSPRWAFLCLIWQLFARLFFCLESGAETVVETALTDVEVLALQEVVVFLSQMFIHQFKSV